jgi:hypothetical protein
MRGRRRRGSRLSGRVAHDPHSDLRAEARDARVDLAVVADKGLLALFVTADRVAEPGVSRSAALIELMAAPEG